MAGRLYRAALRLLPVDDRRRHGTEMSAVFDDLVRDARRRAGWPGVWRVTAAEYLALLRFAVAARRGRPRPRRLDDSALADPHPYGGQWPMCTSLLSEVRYAVRTLARSPGFTLVCAATIALAIGANTAIFTVFHAVVLKALPFAEADRVVVLGHHTRGRAGLDSTTPGNLTDFKARATGFAAMAGFASTQRLVTVNGTTERLRGCLSVGSVFDVLGRVAAAGRTLTEADDDPAAEPVVVLSAGLARRLFGEARAVGHTLTINALPHSVVGVMPPDFAFLDFNDEYWVPARFEPAFRQNRDQYFLLGIARLAPGVDLAQARAQIDTVMDGIRREFPQYTENAAGAVEPAKAVLLDGVERRLEMLMAAVGLVLLIACANLGNLLLARATERRREMAVRQALGAGAARLVRQTLVESLLLALLGGALGVGLAVGLVSVLATLLPQDLPRLAGVAVDGPVVAFAVAVSIAAGLAFAIFPALPLVLRSPLQWLQSGARGSTREGLARHGLVVSQLALALVLLVGAGLLARSFAALLQVSPGFDPARLLTFTASVASPVYAEQAARREFFERVASNLEGRPGVQDVTLTTTLPVTGRGNGAWFNMLDQPWPAGQTPPGVPNRIVRANYFHVMGVPILRGRAFSSEDGGPGHAAVVISESLARRFYADRDPLGRRIYMGAPDNRVVPEAVIVGVAADVKQLGLDEATSETVYIPHRMAPGPGSMTIAVRTAVAPDSLVSEARAAVRAADPGAAMLRIETMDAVLRRATAPARSSMLLVGLFAGAAFALALVGVFGVLSYTVSQRTTEFGIRMALGATAGDVRWHVLGRGARPVALGIVLGLAAALLLARLMASLLFGVTPTDPVTLAGVAALMAVTAMAAAWLPARRATRVDPAQALRP